MSSEEQNSFDTDLTRLGGALRGLERAHAGIPFAILRAVHESMCLTDGLTIDYLPASQLGHPLVVLRPVAKRPPPDVLEAQTPREREVTALVASGLSNKAIARRLGITEGTVKDHVHRILKRTHSLNRTVLARLYGDSNPHPRPAGRRRTSIVR